MQAVAEKAETKKWDLVGISLSILCAIHCLSVPFLLGALPLIGFVANHEFEWVMMGFIFAVAAVSFYHGFKLHRRNGIFWYLAAGVVVFAIIRPLLPESLHPLATLTGGAIFVAGHWKNWRWHRPSCRKPCCSN